MANGEFEQSLSLLLRLHAIELSGVFGRRWRDFMQGEEVFKS
jgi:hypothetical protein